MSREKGIFEIIKLIRESKNLKVQFHFAGEWRRDSDKIEFENLINEDLNLNKIHFHGYVSGKAKEELFLNSDIVVHPSFEDAFPINLIEALSYGLPILAYNIGAVKSIVKGCGFISNPDKLVDDFKLFLESKSKVTLSKNSRSKYENFFTISKFENQLVKILKN